MCKMAKSGLECDVETLFSCPDEEKAYFKRLNTYLHDCRTKITHFLTEELNNYKGTWNKLEQNVELISQLSNETRNLETKLDSLLLDQKVLNKKIANAIAFEESLDDDISKEKARREALTLEMVDLQQELSKQKEAKKKEWNAIKMAIAVYKEKLNIHIDVQHQDDHDTLTVTLFLNTNPNKDNYYIVLQNSHGAWRVSNIQPPLKDKYLTEMKLNLSRDYETLDIARFICQIRSTFLKYYVSHK
ncbi:uncharacterized protein LOC107037910 [Diachasma alloeum]|uniref:uncharacterized protein LOC107037910 n=1 Tax=Diachasma alloeum TaxID=454923 RepID=UPI00073823AE|nr:uncharacterized protein LOC107037910 [Diachasma alloeum]